MGVVQELKWLEKTVSYVKLQVHCEGVSDVSRCRACERSPLVHMYDSWTCPARYLETSSGEVTYYKELNPEDTRTFKLFFSHELCKIVSGHFLEFDFHIWRTGGAAGGRTWRMNPAVERSVLLFTAHPHRRRPSSLKALESPRVSKLTSSSSTCLAPLLHPEIFVFFLFHVRHVFVSSTRPLALCESSGHSPALFSHGLTQKLY